MFYACTGPNPKDGSYTANFGVGCLEARKLGTKDPVSPLSVIPDYPFAEFDYAPSRQINVPGVGPTIVGNSYLNLYKTVPDDYKNRMFAILKDLGWMSLRPKSLAIGGEQVGWPGKRLATSIAMIDTGGGPVFLSDPDNSLWPREFSTHDRSAILDRRLLLLSGSRCRPRDNALGRRERKSFVFVSDKEGGIA